MKKALIGAVIVAAGLASQALAQQPKQAVLKFALNRQYELSTNYSSSQMVWKTAKDKITEATIIAAIGKVLNYPFSSKAQLIIQSEKLSGFENGLDDAPLINFPQSVAGRGINQAVAPGQYIPGKTQPLAFIFIRDTLASSYKFVDVTRFFAIEVQECYDCFYLNSFVTDTTVKFGYTAGPPCCPPDSGISSASGTDTYYMCIAFDNTTYNWAVDDEDFDVVAYDGSVLTTCTAVCLDPNEDGIQPNMNPKYNPTDTSVLRFRVCGIMDYKWKLNQSTYIGTGTLTGSGYGFVKKVCSIIDGKVTLSEYFQGTGTKTGAPMGAYWTTDPTDLMNDHDRYTFWYDYAPYYVGDSM